MIHIATKHNPHGDHYGVSFSSYYKTILLQVQENGKQSRIPLTVEEARHIIQLLELNIQKVQNEDDQTS